MSGWWDDWPAIVSMYRSLPAVLRAQRHLGRARRLRSEGRPLEAFHLALPACGVLAELAGEGHPGASGIIAFDAAWLDDLAKEVGQPGAAREEMQRALRVCEEVAGRSPKLQATLREYIAWYKHRLAEQAAAKLH